MFGIFNKAEKKYKDISSSDFQKIVESRKDVKIVDVRSEMEFRSGKIKGAQLINMMSGDFKDRLLRLPKDQAILLYCRSGNRSGMAARILGDAGYSEVYNLRGGLLSWSGPIQA